MSVMICRMDGLKTVFRIEGLGDIESWRLGIRGLGIGGLGDSRMGPAQQGLLV